MSTNIPVTNLPFLYINGLQVTVGDNTNLTISSGQCRDSTNTNDILFTTGVNLNAATNGVNGLDTGTFAATKTYYVYAIGSSLNEKVPASLMSLSASAPVIPSGYDVFRQIGFAFSDDSVHFLKMFALGNDNYRQLWLDARRNVLAGGTSATFAAVDLSGAIPLMSGIGNMSIYMYYSFTPNTAGDAASIRPTGSASTTFIDITGVVAAKAQVGQIKVVSAIGSSKPEIDYLVAASGSLTLSVQGFDYFI